MQLADLRLRNALILRDHFARKWHAAGDERVRTLETSFAGLLEVNPSHWSQIKSGHRHIGDKLARQIEAKCRLPKGALDKLASEAMPTEMMPPPRIDCSGEDELRAMQLFQVLYRTNPLVAEQRLIKTLEGELLKRRTDKIGQTSRTSVTPMFRKNV